MRLSIEQLQGSNFFLIAGPCCLESREHALFMATKIKEICDRLGIKLIFKASFDKANRTSLTSYRGPGLERGLAILKEVKEKLQVPILTDIHLPEQCAPVAQVCDILQIPAFLCRQTDLLLAAGRTGRIINIKKGQFCNHITMQHAVNKIYQGTGNQQVLLTDRGTMFGYDSLIVDFRNLVLMRSCSAQMDSSKGKSPDTKRCLIVQDCTHALQMPNRAGTTLGQRDLIPSIARAAVAVGVDGLFMEVHDQPEKALSDSTTQWPLASLEPLLKELLVLHYATKGRETNYLR